MMEELDDEKHKEVLKQADEFVLNMLKHDLRNHIAKIKDYLQKYNLTLEEAIYECKSKTCGLNSKQRDMLLHIEVEYLKKLLS